MFFLFHFVKKGGTKKPMFPNGIHRFLTYDFNTIYLDWRFRYLQKKLINYPFKKLSLHFLKAK